MTSYKFILLKNLTIVLTLCVIFSMQSLARSHDCEIIQSAGNNYSGIIHNAANCSNRELKSVLKDLPLDILWIDLNNNEITILLNSSFERYSMLLTIILDNNKLSVIEATAFFGMEKLLNLSMEKNNFDFSKLNTNETFRYLASLELLNIRQTFNDLLLSPLTYPYIGHLINLRYLQLT